MKQLIADLDALEDRQYAGDVFERVVVPYLLTNAPQFRAQFTKVWHWADYPDRDGADLGIDLVAEDRQGERIAIQAKCYAPDSQHSWRGLSTFYGDAVGRSEIGHLMLITTAAGLSPNAHKKLEATGAIWVRSDLLKLGISPSLTLADVLAMPST